MGTQNVAFQGGFEIASTSEHCVKQFWLELNNKKIKEFQSEVIISETVNSPIKVLPLIRNMKKDYLKWLRFILHILV